MRKLNETMDSTGTTKSSGGGQMKTHEVLSQRYHRKVLWLKMTCVGLVWLSRKQTGFQQRYECETKQSSGDNSTINHWERKHGSKWWNTDWKYLRLSSHLSNLVSGIRTRATNNVYEDVSNICTSGDLSSIRKIKKIKQDWAFQTTGRPATEMMLRSS